MSLPDRWSTVLDALRSAGRYRALTESKGLDLTSNDYLGYGSGSSTDFADYKPPLGGKASRLLRGHTWLWEYVESGLAGWHGAESALMFTCGYMANEGLLSALIETDDWVASDEYNHASIIDGLRLNRPRRFVYRHNDLNHLEDGLRSESARRAPGREFFVVTESLFGMDGDRTPLVEIAALAERYGAALIVDEAHATGCFGPTGSGRVDELGLRSRVLATIHTGGKALSVPGAYVCGSARLREYLINRCRQFIFTTALPEAIGIHWGAAVWLVAQDDSARKALRRNATEFRAALKRAGVNAPGSDYIVPVIVGADAAAVRVAGRLQEAGYDIRAIRPPTVPEGTARLRVSIHADHDAKMLQDAAEALAEAIGEEKTR